MFGEILELAGLASHVMTVYGLGRSLIRIWPGRRLTALAGRQPSRGVYRFFGDFIRLDLALGLGDPWPALLDPLANIELEILVAVK